MALETGPWRSWVESVMAFFAKTRDETYTENCVECLSSVSTLYSSDAYVRGDVVEPTIKSFHEG